MNIEDLAKEKRGNNPEELSLEDEKDVYAACITYWTKYCNIIIKKNI